MTNKPSVIIRMGAANWDVRVFDSAGRLTAHRNLRTMEKRERSDFHREFMNAFRATTRGK